MHQATAVAARLPELPDWEVCYQSRVGPLAWIGPPTDDSIRRAAADGKGVILTPIAFVSEHEGASFSPTGALALPASGGTGALDQALDLLDLLAQPVAVLEGAPA